MVNISKAKYFVSVTDAAKLDESIAEVAFVGRSNVGKSSVINAVCKCKGLARTSQTPGRTRAINVFSAGPGRWLVDLPGYGFARGPAEEQGNWPAMIEGYLTGRSKLRMVYVIVDGYVGPTKLDISMADWLNANNIPFTVVANKADRVSVPQQNSQREKVAAAMGKRSEDIHWISAERGTGIPELIRAVETRLG